jgi:hypothetical protein
MWMLGGMGPLHKHVVSRCSGCLRSLRRAGRRRRRPYTINAGYALVGLGYPDVHVAHFAHDGRIPGSVSAAVADLGGNHLALGCGCDGDRAVLFRPVRVSQYAAREPRRDAVPALSPTLLNRAGHSAHPARKLEPGRAFVAGRNLARHTCLDGSGVAGANRDFACHA